MSDAKTIAALQHNLADEMVERLRLVERVAELEEYEKSFLNVFFERGQAEARARDLEAQLAASHLAAQRMATEAVAAERERLKTLVLRDGIAAVFK